MSAWTRTRVAPVLTHHTLDGAPLYDERFDEVLSFHMPGLAAVRRGAFAWHIDEHGLPAYAARFARTFGFYEGLAAVDAGEYWHFVTPDGETASPDTFAWCGNYQDARAPVRDNLGRYFHLDPTGTPAYHQRWRYAGDFYHGVAVVQDDRGRSTHIDRYGQLLHARWFDDLDTFHKGHARARDRDGWCHVDRRGDPIYARRFATVEPFYNGQARVERHDGALEILDERGNTLHTLRPPQRDEFHTLSADMVGIWRTATIAAAVTLDVPAALPSDIATLARRRDLPAAQARRLLRALGELRLVDERAGVWHLTARGRYLHPDHPETLADAALAYQGPLLDRWRTLPEVLRSPHLKPPDIFATVAADSSRIMPHHRMQQSYARHDYAAVVAAIDVPAGARILDAGGGTGTLACLLLDRTPDATAVVLERPEVAALIPQRSRLSAVPADLFAPWPVRGELVVLARVLHDWDDHDARTILHHARQALVPGGHLVIVELVLDDQAFGGSLCDLHLAVACGGRERTLAEWTALLESTGFTAPRHDPIAGIPQILTAVPT